MLFRSFLVTVMIARSFRYYIEGVLAVFYGRRVLSYLRDNGLVILSLFTAVAVVIILVYAIINRRGPRPKDVSADTSVEQKLPPDS